MVPNLGNRQEELTSADQLDGTFLALMVAHITKSHAPMLLQLLSRTQRAYKLADLTEQLPRVANAGTGR